jgi:hypothetical protein
MWPPTEFEVHLWVDGPEPDQHFVTELAGDVVNAFVADYPSLLEILTHVRTPGSRGTVLSDLLVWCNGEGMAWVRLLDYQDERPTDDSRSQLTGEVGGFPEPRSEAFAVPAADAITVAQAAQVLRYWLSCGGKDPGLTWNFR